jgi:predicted dehydrogenase
MNNPSRIGLVGAGVISATYLKARDIFPELDFRAVADIDAGRAKERAAGFGIESLTVDALLANPDIDLILNLTIPAAHSEVSLAALDAGKGVYSEKPLSIRGDDGRQLLERSKELDLPLGCAPDTFLGAGLQTCRAAIDQGRIGRPLAATAFMMSPGPESWHANPHFFYQPGAGPLFDMGPYYLTALVHLLGAVERVSAMNRAGFDERVASTGEVIPVNTPTHVAVNLEHAGGALSTLVTSFDVQASILPRIEIYGTEATLAVPDPNTFGGPVRIHHGRKTSNPNATAPTDQVEDITLVNPYKDQSRGLGLAEMIRAHAAGRAPRASGELSFHVLEIMELSLASAETGTVMKTTTQPARPEALIPGPLSASFE